MGRRMHVQCQSGVVCIIPSPPRNATGRAGGAVGDEESVSTHPTWNPAEVKARPRRGGRQKGSWGGGAAGESDAGYII